ncbi:hypothetical protein OQA88_11232 [Cercophora sp. LCS_1]
MKLTPLLATSLSLSTTVLAGTLTALTINVAGLPALLNPNDVPGSKETNAKTIGSKFAQYGYDIIHMQEDFNYHAKIYETDNHPYRTATSGGVPFGSGLNTVSKHAWVDFRRIKWNMCSDASSSDCLTPKGFTFMRVLIGSNTSGDRSVETFVDCYNLHTDAGVEPADITARQANVNQVAAYISTWSQGNAVLVFGDLNSRYSRTGDTAIRDLLASQNKNGPGLKDAWVEVERGGAVPTAETLCSNPSTTDYCETVDKVFYRSSPLVTLEADDFGYVSKLFLQPDGNILSDHNPVLVNFTWTAGTSLRQSGFWGGPHGNWFSDVPALAGLSEPKVSVISLRGGSRLDSVGLTLVDGTKFNHGGSGGSLVSLTLAASEFLTGAELCQGQRSGQTRNFFIRAVTSTGRSIQAGTRTTECATFTAPSGWQIVGFMGQDGDEVDQLAFVYAPR